MAPISTQNGRIRSVTCGTRKNEVLATSSAETLRDVARAAHQLDVVEQRDQHENADEHQQHRAQEAQAEIARECSAHDRHGQLTGVAKRRVDALGERGEPVGEEGRRLQDQAAADHVEAADEGERHRHVLQRQHPRHGGAEHGGGKADQPQQRHRRRWRRASTACGFAGWCAARRDRRRRSPRRRADRAARSAGRAVRRGTGPAAR